MNKPTPFRQAVNHLKSLGIIKRDNDLLKTLDMTSKGALSAYIGGNPPTHIIDKFLNKYGEHVRQFFEEGNLPKAAASYHEKYVRLLEDQLEFLKEKVQANLTGISENIIVSRATARAAIDYQVMKDSKGDEKKRELLMEQINKLIHLQLTGGQKANNHSASDR